jgi:DNA ligase-1
VRSAHSAHRGASTFSAFAAVCEELEGTRARNAKAQLVADYLRSLPSDEVPVAARMIIGRVFPEQEGRPMNWSGAAVQRTVGRIVKTTTAARTGLRAEAVDFGQAVQLAFERGKRLLPQGAPLMLGEVWEVFQRAAVAGGAGSRQRKDDILQAILQRASAVEAKYLVKLAVGEMRHGLSEGLLLDAIAAAADVEPAVVRRANMTHSDVGAVAQLALSKGVAALQRIRAIPGHPVKPMLAQTANSVQEAIELLDGRLALEYKLDGARLQIHKVGARVWLFSRNLSDLTASLPEVQDVVAHEVRAEKVILEGEVIALGADGRPLPFQVLMRRLGRVRDIEALRRQVPVRLYLFDLLHVDGEDYLDRPYHERVDRLRAARGNLSLVERSLTASAAQGEAFLAQARQAGHEGLMAKGLDSPYTPGVRGRNWLKIKPAVTLDLVIVAADWGYGRRHGWLSNYHLAALDEGTGAFMEVGKTFKGLTDDEFRRMTARLLTLQVRQAEGTIHVRPEVVVEVAFNNIQDSPSYPSRMALRFARIVRLRADKTAEEADTLQTMQRLQTRWR